MTGSRVRVFVAVDLPDTVKAEMGKLIALIEALEVRGVRSVRAEGLHLTLRFLGDVDSDVVPSIISAMETAAAESAPFELTLAGTGAFPNTAAPRTLWVGMKGDLDRARDTSARCPKCAGDGRLRPERGTVQPPRDDRASP